MERTNTLSAHPKGEEIELMFEVLDASASLWNETNYRRRQKYFDGESIWSADTDELEKRYKPILGSCTTQQIIRKNSKAWRSYFSSKEKWKDGELDGKPGVPGYKGNKEEGRDLHTCIRNDRYKIRYGKNYSYIEIPIGKKLKDKYGYGHQEKPRIEIRGKPRWCGEDSRLEIKYDRVNETFRVYHPVTIQDSPLTDQNHKSVALDVGVNNIVAATTTTGKQYLYRGKKEYRKFRRITKQIDSWKQKLGSEYTSERIQHLYNTRRESRDHMLDGLIKDLVGKLVDDGITRVFVGDLSGVLESHWCAKVNEMTHNFWSHGKIRSRLKDKCEENDIEFVECSEDGTSQRCPRCGSEENTTRFSESLVCSCGFEGHADLVASWNFLEKQGIDIDGDLRSMARPVSRERWMEYRDATTKPNSNNGGGLDVARLEWDNHEWRSTKDACKPQRVAANLRDPENLMV